jgi:Protein of unknown function (DUF1588)/Protein of unknown function (DUF1592)/Protein of unknown function (DUF1595)/Protein of unknown function (DUF1587)
MKSNAARFSGGSPLGVACSIATFVGWVSMSVSMSACTAVGSISGGPGAGSTGTTSPSGAGGTGAGSVPGTTGTGGIQVITGPATTSSWYDAFSAADCTAAPTALPATRIWRLSASQWSNTVAQALSISAPNVASFPQDQVDPGTGFSDDSTGDKVTLPLASAYFDASDAVATQAAPAALTAFACLATAPIPTSCGGMFVTSYGQKLFRRALTPTEVTTYATYLNSESKLDPAQTAVASTIKAMLMSPNFIYRTELGSSKAGTVDLTSDEIASLLSYSIADAPPDAQLQAAAAAGQLSDPAMRTTQAERLAALPAAKTKLSNFWNEYLALGTAPTAAGIDQSTYNEAMTFFSKVVWDNSGSLKDLLTAPYTYADATAAAVYGTAKPDATGKLTLDPTQRAGFLTSLAMLTQTSAVSQAATVIHRGLLVRERVLCETPPPPPPTVVPDPAQIQQAGADATARENYNLFAMTHASCNACHQTFQPLGLAFENYDGVGKFRAAYPSGKPIDATGTLTSAGDAMGDYTSAVDMANKLGGSKITQYCFAQQFAEFAFGRPVSFSQETCTIRSMGDYVTGKGGQVHELLASFAAAPTVYRRIHQ